jgi:cell wall-associated NlpC family hydrolase
LTLSPVPIRKQSNSKSMLKKLPVICLIFFTSCESLKQIGVSNNKQIASAPTLTTQQKEKEVKFLDNINSEPASTEVSGSEVKKTESHSNSQIANTTPTYVSKPVSSESKVETTASIQAKYASLLKTDESDIQNMLLYKNIDDWYGTPYHYGGTSKDGIDCSGFVQTIFIASFGVTLPRTAKEQYKYVKLISSTQLKEGDLLFFNTTGGVSHVAIYLQNNKFIHASVANGVTITDMYEPYYVKHFIGAGRIENNTATYHPENVYPKPGTHKKKKKKSSSNSSSKKK